MHKKKYLPSIPEVDEEEKWVSKKRHEVLKAKYKCLKKLFQIYDENLIRTNNNKDLGRKIDVSAGTESSQQEIAIKSSNTTIETIKEDTKTIQEGNTQTNAEQLPYKSKPSKFKFFLHRLFGIRFKHHVMPDGHVLAVSDNNLLEYRKSRRRGLRLRRRPRQIHSDSALHHKPMILNYVQTVQKHCLQDTTSRQCPIVDCRMIFHGIINYNDHLNLCHFVDKKYACHYCHEGFEREFDKLSHENEHLGIPKLNLDRGLSKHELSDVPKDKLKKLVSFIDKIIDSDAVSNTTQRNFSFESNIINSCISSDDTLNDNKDKDKTLKKCMDSFGSRQKICLHNNLDNEVMKFHKIPNRKPKKEIKVENENGTLKIRSIEQSKYNLDSTDNISNTTHNLFEEIKSKEVLNSSKSDEQSSVDNLNLKLSNLVRVQSMKNELAFWIPGTKIIRL